MPTTYVGFLCSLTCRRQTTNTTSSSDMIIILLPPMALFFAFIDAYKQWHLRQILLIILLLQYHNNIRDRHCLLRSAIVQPKESPWRSLYIHADETSFLHMTGLSWNAFAILLDYLFDL